MNPAPLPALTPVLFRPAFPPATIAAIALIAVLTLVLAPFVSRLLCRMIGRERSNFQGIRIPASVGLTFLLVTGAFYGGLAFFLPSLLPLVGDTLSPALHAAPVFLFVAVGFGILGLIDDIWGTRAVGGLRGHIGALRRGRVTTGMIKLVGGGMVAFVAALAINGPQQPLRLALDFLLIALSANALNLLDVRPGRAQFGFLLMTLPTAAALALQGMPWLSSHPPPALLLGPLALAAATEWWPDSRGRAMMGDTGSNLLGAVAGLAAALTLPLSGHFFLLAALIALHWLSEKISLSALIAETPWLHAIDRQLGVR